MLNKDDQINEQQQQEQQQQEQQQQEQQQQLTILKSNLSGSENDIKPTKWDDDFEKICACMIDEAQINTFLHLKSHRSYSVWSTGFQLPIIILSAIVGSANFASSNFGEYRDNLILIIGGISIVISIISSIAQYLKLAELKEGHRISSFHWEKFYSKLKIQLMLKRESRRKLPDFYDDILTEYQRLKEISPIFNKGIQNSAKKNEGYKYLNIPFYLNGFKPVIPYEKAMDDYKLHYLNNKQDKVIEDYIKELNSLKKKDNLKTEKISPLDENIINSKIWETTV